MKQSTKIEYFKWNMSELNTSFQYVKVINRKKFLLIERQGIKNISYYLYSDTFKESEWDMEGKQECSQKEWDNVMFDVLNLLMNKIDVKEKKKVIKRKTTKKK